MTKNFSSRLGFTLLETVITVALFVGLALVAGRLGCDLWVNRALVENSLTAETEARSAVKNLVAELRGATAGDNGAYTLVLASSTAITFFSDVDGDGHKEEIRYFVSGTDLKRGLIKPSANVYLTANEKIITVAHNLSATSSLFSYYDNDDDNWLASSTPLVWPFDLSLVRLVKLSLSLQPDPNRPFGDREFESAVTIRSLKDNL